MLTVTEIRDKALRQYSRFLASVVTGEAFFPLPIRFGKPSPTATFEELQNAFSTLREAERQLGLQVTWTNRTTLKWGVQSFPEDAAFTDEQAYLKAIGKASEVRKFHENVELIRSRCPELGDWTRRFPSRIAVMPDEWAGLLSVCRYFLENPKPKLYPRQLPIGVHSKFIDYHHDILRELLNFLLKDQVNEQAETFEARFHLLQPEAQVRIRFLDQDLQKRFGICLEEISTPFSQARSLAIRDVKCLIVENLMIFLTLPRLKDTVAIFGAGKAAALLPFLPWLGDCSLFYWGDMDDAGFRILSNLRNKGLSVESLLMDEATWNEFEALAHVGAIEKGSQDLLLTTSEVAVWKIVQTRQKMLEQELLPQDYVEEYLLQKFPLSDSAIGTSGEP